jgi:hypothetical protein
MEKDLDTSAIPAYWYRDGFPDLLGRRLSKAHSEFLREAMQIDGDRAHLRTHTIEFGGPGRVGTYRKPDPEARLARFRQICALFIQEVLEALVEHLVERVGLRGVKAVKEFEKTAGEYARQALEHNWSWKYARGANDELFWRLANEAIEIQKANLQALWPKRGRPPAPPKAEITGESKRGRTEKGVLPSSLIGRAERLLAGDWTRESLALECKVDPQTLRKALRGDAITRSRVQLIITGIASAEQQNSRSRI